MCARRWLVRSCDAPSCWCARGEWSAAGLVRRPARACHGPDSVLAEFRERRLGAALAQVGAAVALQGAVGAGAVAGGNRAARRPRLRVPDPAEARHHRAQL